MNARFSRLFCPQRLAVWLSASGGRAVTALLLPLLLAGCAEQGVSRDAPHAAENFAPRAQLADYRVASCDLLWRIDSSDASNNVLYWLRAMECAGQLTPAQARARVSQVGDRGWAGMAKQAILLDNADASPSERRQMLDQLIRQRSAMLPLLQIWIDKQNLILSLEDERQRFQRTQETNDKQLEALKEQQTRLQSQLDTTTRKLENLTDIERQLSSRKPGTGVSSDDAYPPASGVKKEGSSQ